MPRTVEEWYQWVDQFTSRIILDGGLGSLLTERGNDLNVGCMWSGRLILSNPAELSEVAHLWLEAGSDLITTATYQVTKEQLCEEFQLSGKDAEAVMHSSVGILRDRRNVFWNALSSAQRNMRRFPKLGASMGPFSALLPDTDEYSGDYSNVTRSDLLRFHSSRCSVFDKLASHEDHAVDVYCFETIGNLDEAIAIVECMTYRTRASVPFWISFQCRDAERIASGDRLSFVVERVLSTCSSKNLVAIGVNCVDVNNVKNLIDIAKHSVDLHMLASGEGGWRVDLLAYPNSGEVWIERGWVWPDNSPVRDDGAWAKKVHETSARLVGGCCRIGPKDIEALHTRRLQESVDRYDPRKQTKFE